MNNKLLILMAAIVGAGVGSFVTYKVVEKKIEDRLDEKYEKLLQEEIQSMAGVSVRRVKSDEQVEDDKKKAEVMDEALKETEKEHYNEITEIYKSRDGESDDDGIEEPYIHIITEEQYSTENLMYDKELLYYYVDDDILVDEDTEILSDISDMIGSLELYDLDWEVNKVVCVRNDNRQIDYHIECVQGNYHELILGYTPDDK